MLAERRSPRGQCYGPNVIARFEATAALLPPPPATILDAGCGAGVLTDYLGALGYDATGADIAAATMKQMRSPHITASIDALPLKDRSFDAVVASEVLEHLPIEVYEAARLEVGRVARETILITVPNRESLESATTRCPACSCIYSLNGHVRRFEAAAMKDLVPGWRLTRLREVGPYRLRHRTIEWYVRRRLLGRWPAGPQSSCPQCHYRQLGKATGEGPSAGGGMLRRVAAFPWRHRWWLVAKYERDATPDAH